MSEELLLHQYALSPFSEKIRKVLAHKGLAWRAVDQPVVAPKPDLTPLTGGYRKIPVLQIGAEIWCDTAAIVPRLEELRPEPSVFEGGRGAHEILAHWADHWLFMAAVPPAIVTLLPALPPEFLADRAAMSPGFDAGFLEAALPDARSRLAAGAAWLEAQLAGRDFLLDRFGLADAACFHVLWFLKNDRPTFEATVGSRPALAAWFDRVESMGSGESSPLAAADALAIARAATPPTSSASVEDPNGLRAGDEVAVAADDYGTDPVSGTIVSLDASGIAIRRTDETVGEVVVHFPRAGFRIQRA